MLKYSKVILLILFCESVGFLSSFFVMGELDTWYMQLQKPFFQPPNSIFGPVWTVLYALMGVFLYKIWESKKSVKAKLLPLFWIQLALNFLWSLFFFKLHNPLLGLIDISALLIILLVLFRKSYIETSGVSFLLIPYIVWVSFATLLNLSILFLN